MSISLDPGSLIVTHSVFDRSITYVYLALSKDKCMFFWCNRVAMCEKRFSKTFFDNEHVIVKSQQ